MTWTEFKTLTVAERRAIGYAVVELQKEQGHTITGQTRQDKRFGLV